MTHGVLSTALVLPSERREDFDALFEKLADELGAVGTLENVLVERVAIAMWRQRRLVRAESAQIQLRQSNQASLRGTGTPLKYRPSEELVAMSVDRMFDSGQLELFADEWERSLNLRDLNFEQIQTLFPVLTNFFAFSENLDGTASPRSQEDLLSIIESSREAYLSAIRDHQVNQSFSVLRRDAMAVPESVDTLARYQSTLDNELYKALRALREAQAFRRKNLDGEPLNKIEPVT